MDEKIRKLIAEIPSKHILKTMDSMIAEVRSMMSELAALRRENMQLIQKIRERRGL